MIDHLGTTYPGRRWVVPLSVTVMVGFGVILYGFSVYATDEAAGGEFSKTALSLAYGGSVFVGGLFALPVGRFADRHGVRTIIGVGAVLGSVGLVGFSLANQPWHLMAVWWIFLGPAQAMIYYEPVYVAIEQWSVPANRARTLATITLIGGLAGIVFIPLVAQLVSVFGWRSAVRGLGLLLLIVGILTVTFALPSGRGTGPSSKSGSQSNAVSLAFVRERRFVLFTLAQMLILLATQGVIAHRVARFQEIGYSLGTVALWAAAASAMSLPGRWIAPRLAERFGATWIQAAISLIVAVSVVLMVKDAPSWQMIGHFFLFGLAFGALLPLRAMVMADWYSGPTYGRIMGTQWTAVVLVAATGPILVGVMRDSTGAYQSPFVLLSALFVVAAALIVASGRALSAESIVQAGAS